MSPEQREGVHVRNVAPELLKWERMHVTKYYPPISMQTVMFDMHVRDLMCVNRQRWSDSAKKVFKYGNHIQSVASTILLVNKTDGSLSHLIPSQLFSPSDMFPVRPTDWSVYLFTSC